MYLKKKKRRNGDIYLTIVEKYYAPNVGARERTIEKIGRLSELKEKYDDPIAHYTAYAKKLTEEAKKRNFSTVTIDLTAELETGTDDTRNVGYGILKMLLLELHLENFWTAKIHNADVRRNTETLFRTLIYNHILCLEYESNPFDNKEFFFEPIDEISQIGIIESLDIIDIYYKELQIWIKNHTVKTCDIDIRPIIDDAKQISKQIPELYSSQRSHAYYIVCFTSLVLLSLLDERLNHKFDTGTIIDSLKKYNCTHLETNRWQFTYYDEVLDAIAKCMDIQLDKKYMTREEIQRLLRY